jgi:hypothetical protein
VCGYLGLVKVWLAQIDHSLGDSLERNQRTIAAIEPHQRA